MHRERFILNGWLHRTMQKCQTWRGELNSAFLLPRSFCLFPDSSSTIHSGLKVCEGMWFKSINLKRMIDLQIAPCSTDEWSKPQMCLAVLVFHQNHFYYQASQYPKNTKLQCSTFQHCNPFWLSILNQPGCHHFLRFEGLKLGNIHRWLWLLLVVSYGHWSPPFLARWGTIVGQQQLMVAWQSVRMASTKKERVTSTNGTMVVVTS